MGTGGGWRWPTAIAGELLALSNVFIHEELLRTACTVPVLQYSQKSS